MGCLRRAAAGLLAALFLVGLPGPLFADTILLRDGSRVEGSIIGQNVRSVLIRARGGVQTVPKASIRRLVYGVTQAEKKEQAALARQRARARRIQNERRRRAELEKAERAEAEAEQRRRERRELVEKLDAALIRIRELEKSLKKERSSRLRLPGPQIWKSILFPGWGQLHAGEQHRGWALVGGGSAGALAGFLLWNETRAARTTYDAAVTESIILTQLTTSPAVGLFGNQAAEQAHAKLEQQAGRFRTAMGVFALVYLFSLVDSLFLPGSAEQPTAAAGATGPEGELAASGRLRAGWKLRLMGSNWDHARPHTAARAGTPSHQASRLLGRVQLSIGVRF